MKKKNLVMLIIAIFIACIKPVFAQEEWNMKVSLDKHQIVIRPGDSHGLYNGKDFYTAPAVVKDDRIYFSLGLMEELAQVNWNAPDQFADVKIPEENIHLRYRVGESLVYSVDDDDKESPLMPTPAPFIQNHTFYFPIKDLDQALHKKVILQNHTLIISWSRPYISVQNMPILTDKNTLDFKILVEEGLEKDPIIMQATHDFGFMPVKNSDKKELLIDGVKYSQVSTKLPLRAGLNPFYLWVEKDNYQQKESFLIKREVKESFDIPVSYHEEGYSQDTTKYNFQITQPDKGYVNLPLPGSIEFKGKFDGAEFEDKDVTINVGQLEGWQFLQDEQYSVSTVDGRFSQEIDFAQPGTYLVEVTSTQYSPDLEEGLVRTHRAEICVEVGNRSESSFARRLADTGIEMPDLNDLLIINSNFIDLNLDGRKDEIYIIANPYSSKSELFSAPGYLIYSLTPNGKFSYLKLDFPPIDLYPGNIHIQFGDLNSDKITEIFYSVDYPQPEHVERWPHLLQFHPETGEFTDLDILLGNDYIVRDWGIEINRENGQAELRLDLKKAIYDNEGIPQYFRIYQDRLVKRENYTRLMNPIVNHQQDPIVEFPDENLERLIRKEIDKLEGPIYQSELLGIAYLSAVEKDINSLDGIEYVVNLQELNLSGNRIQELRPIEKLTSLKILNLSRNKIQEIGSLEKLVNLEELYLGNNGIKDLSHFKALKKLNVLYLDSCGISSIQSLGEMPSLRSLDLSRNCLLDIRPLAGLVYLKGLSLEYNQIVNIQPLAKLFYLGSLALGNNRIEDVSPLKDLSNLKWVGLSGNFVTNIEDISPQVYTDFNR